MNYTIPKDRQQAIEIYSEYMRFYDSQLVDSIPTKYYMFVGALTECSDEEFNEHTKYAYEKEVICELCKYYSENCWCGHSSGCKTITEELFSKRWNE